MTSSFFVVLARDRDAADVRDAPPREWRRVQLVGQARDAQRHRRRFPLLDADQRAPQGRAARCHRGGEDVRARTLEGEKPLSCFAWAEANEEEIPSSDLDFHLQAGVGDAVVVHEVDSPRHGPTETRDEV